MNRRFTRDDVEILDDAEGYNGFFKLRRLTLRHRLFAGGWSKPISRELVLRHAAVGVLLYDPQLDSVALLEQFRVGPLPGSGSPWLYELVAGLIDTDESVETVARREAKEEAGCSIQRLEKITAYYTSPGGSNEYFHLYCGLTDLGQAGGIHGLAAEGEDIRVQVVGFDEAWQWLLHGRIGNAHTLIAMQWLKLNRERIRYGAQA